MATVFRDIFGHLLILTPERRRHVLSEHPEIAPYLERLEGVFRVGVAKIGRQPQALTAYITDAIKEGELVWPKR